MENHQYELELETQRLLRTVSFAETQLDLAWHESERNSEAIASLQEEMRDNASHSVSNLWDSQNFEDLVALSQYTFQINQKVAASETTENRISALERLIDSPYFARIDFKFDDEETFENVYIGRYSLMDDDTGEIYIYDWRSPIAGMFYRFTTGPAYYDAPAGRMSGEISLKRQYEIKNGILKYFFDADVQIIDEFLRQLLSQNTSPQMKTIVETIQKEQDVVIRDMENDLMIVQGAAGSGKSSIALHRVAFLMYNGLSSGLAAKNIIIISPNALFERYISNVLPELGEENAVSAVFEEIMAEVLQSDHIQTRNQFLEIMLTNPRYKNTIKRSLEFKASPHFLEALNKSIDNLRYRDKTEFLKLKKEAASIAGLKSIYGRLFENPGISPDIVKYTHENLKVKTIYYDDAAVLTYLKLKINGVDGYKNIKQVVIDEAQDYYPIHYEIFNMMFPGAKYTILGDVNQTLEKQEDMSMYTQISEILSRKKSALVTMDKSYRCTNEILNFSSKFISQDAEIKSFNRSGQPPEIFTAANTEDLIDMIVTEAKTRLKEGWQSVGLICKTEKNALTLFKNLNGKIDVRVMKNESPSELRGVFIIPVYLSKGLEFDAVLICDADDMNYNNEDDKKLLYISCTRALHRLSLFCEGKISPLV